MKYETPELTELTPAINAIQILSGKPTTGNVDSQNNEGPSAYEDWE